MWSFSSLEADYEVEGEWGADSVQEHDMEAINAQQSAKKKPE